MSHVLNEAGLVSTVAFTVKEYFSAAPGVKSLNEVGPPIMELICGP